MQIDKLWQVVEEQFDPDKMGHNEALFTLANGYLGARGAFEEDYRLRKPGTFVAGLFDKAENEVTELANLPDWLGVEITLAGERFDLTQGTLSEYQRILDLKRGVLIRSVTWESPNARRTKLRYTRFVSMADLHLSGIEVEVTPLNYDGCAEIISSLDGQVTNSGTQHFVPKEQCTFSERGIYLLQRTQQSGYWVAQAANHRVEGEVVSESFRNAPRRIDYLLATNISTHKTTRITKYVSTMTSRDFPEASMKQVLDKTLHHSEDNTRTGIRTHLDRHVKTWADYWNRADIQISGPGFDQLAIRFAIFHLLQMAPRHDHRVSIAAKGLSGEAYRGHVFWDTEIYMLPFFIYSFPEIAKNLLLYRYHTLPGAKRKASAEGFKGAMYAWESADTGDETTPELGGIDLVTRKPIAILCGKQEQHITADVAYGVWAYYQATRDEEFLSGYGAEILALTARFWASRVSYNSQVNCFEIKDVIGPDEYKEGVDNNYYTNSLVQWHLRTAAALDRKVLADVGIEQEEVDRWKDIADRIKLPQEGTLLHQFDGFTKLKKIDVTQFRNAPGSLHKRYGWRDINKAQVLKQADVLMLLHLLGFQYSQEIKRANWDYYEPITVHDSSLSPAIHCIVGAELGITDKAYQYFKKACRIDLGDEMANSDAGLHGASLGGLWQAVVHGFAGIRLVEGELSVEPHLPDEWEEISLQLVIQGVRKRVRVTHQGWEIESSPEDNPLSNSL